jgi:hypothetical protein
LRTFLELTRERRLVIQLDPVVFSAGGDEALSSPMGGGALVGADAGMAAGYASRRSDRNATLHLATILAARVIMWMYRIMQTS